ncbi:Chlamydia CHLPS protein (DUF818) [Chlamydia serpentis]|uniref:Chlamydia CHLPS protein (DUF818) n=1 Tax=Chlamydia serpentis TaxID=1967782 RepID=A0A2R8FCP5_9CHLA|nr:CPn0927/CPn0928 family alpha/beta hydrolase fold protein [Chlamydia serpentis]SPN74037.1 Chlamydia CHLPS protein (DUF818) [Chlamydia serpentis]
MTYVPDSRTRLSYPINITGSQPPVIMFSSNNARIAWERRLNHPRLFKIIKIIWNIVKLIICTILLIPLGIFWVLEKLCQFAILPASFISERLSPKTVENIKISSNSNLQHLLNVKEISSFKHVVMQYDDLTIDSLSIEIPNAHPNRWILFSQGNCGTIEKHFNEESDVLELAKATRSNILMFNYPGVMSSRGSVTRENLIKSYQACVRYLRDENQGPKANQIIAYGYSLGTSIQAAALDREITDGSDKIKWILIKDRGPRSFADVAFQFYKPLACIVKLLGWNIDSTKYSEKLLCPEIFIYNSDNNDNLIGDGLFNKETCFAAPFLDPDRKKPPGNKIPVPEQELLHYDSLSTSALSRVAKIVSEYLDAED